MRRSMLFILATTMAVALGAGAQAQTAAEIAQQLAPTGKLRVGLLMLTYFANENAAAGQPVGLMPDHPVLVRGHGRACAAEHNHCRRSGFPHAPGRLQPTVR